MFVCVFVCLFPLWLMLDGETCVCMCVFFPPLILHLVRNLRGRNVFVCVSPQNHPSGTYAKGKKSAFVRMFPSKHRSLLQGEEKYVCMSPLICTYVSLSIRLVIQGEEECVFMCVSPQPLQ